MSFHRADWMTGLEGQVLVSLLLLGILAVAGWLARFARVRAGDGKHARVVNAIIALVLLGLAVAVGWTLAGLWNLSVARFIADPVQLVTRIVVTLVLLVGVYLGTGVVKRVIFEFTQNRTSVSQHQTELVSMTTQVALYILAGIVMLGVWEVNLGGLLVGAGFLGIVVGFAARQTLGSLIAGFVLMFARPFEIGDWIEIGDHEGIVTEITIVNTRIQTFDGEYAMIPNDVVGSSQIINRTRKGRLRLHVVVGVDYSTDLERAQGIARDAIAAVDPVLTVPQPDIVIRGFGPSAIDLDCRFWIDKPSARRQWRAQTAAVKAVKAAFNAAGIKIPFPQRELMSRAEAGGFRVGDGRPDLESSTGTGQDG